MTDNVFTRRSLLSLATTSAAAASLTSATRAAAAPIAGILPPLAPLDRFIADYMRAMNAPGLTLGLANRDGAVKTAAYGYADLDARAPVTTSHLFEIGSITKSFAALVVLQLQDEGKLDVQHPILRHLPSLPIETDYGEIRIHHLLTHCSGMPGDGDVYPARGRARQAFTPGAHFDYCNWGYDVLGALIEKLEGAAWPAVLRRRLLAPLGMVDTAPSISSAVRARIARSYQPLHDDRPYPRHAALVPAGNLSFDGAAGCIASTPLDMTRYMQMLLNRGVGPHGRVVSEAAFKLFSTAHIKADEFGPEASYGYGIAVDQIDGHARLRHTGGMASFASSMHVDLDAGVAAFASINAMQGYRPNPVAQYAIRLMRHAADGTTAPTPPRADAADVVDHPEGYAGVYLAHDGRKLEVVVDGEHLVLRADGERVPLQPLPGEDQFVADHPRYALYALVFGREKPASEPAKPTDPTPPVIELGWGPESYVHDGRYKGDRKPRATPDLAQYTGMYCDTSGGVARIVARKGELWIDGVTPLVPIGERVFRIGREPFGASVLELARIVDGKARVCVVNGFESRRVETFDEGPLG